MDIADHSDNESWHKHCVLYGLTTSRKSRKSVKRCRKFVHRLSILSENPITLVCHVLIMTFSLYICSTKIYFYEYEKSKINLDAGGRSGLRPQHEHHLM